MVAERSSLELLFAVGQIDEEEGCVGVHELLPRVTNVAAFDHVVVEEQVGDLHQGLVHPVLCIQEVVWMPSLDQTSEEGSRSLHLELESRTELLLISDHDNLLSVDRAQESFVFLDHGRFVHDDSFEFSLTKLLSASFADSGHDYWH